MPDSKESKDAAHATAMRGKQIEALLKAHDIPMDRETALAMFSLSIIKMVRLFGPLKLSSTAGLLIDIWRRCEGKLALEMLADIVLEDVLLEEEENTVKH